MYAPSYLLSKTIDSFGGTVRSHVDFNRDDLITLSSGRIATILDAKTGATIQETSAHGPTQKAASSVFGGRKSATFDGASNYLQSASSVALGGATKFVGFCVYRRNASTGGFQVLYETSANYNNNAGSIASFLDIGTLDYYFGFNGAAASKQATKSSTSRLLEGVYVEVFQADMTQTGAPSAAFRHWSNDNGGNLRSFSAGAASNDATSALVDAVMNIGARNGTSAWFSGDISELGIITGTDVDLHGLGRWLLWRNGLMAA